jgi:hypothetical protein
MHSDIKMARAGTSKFDMIAYFLQLYDSFSVLRFTLENFSVLQELYFHYLTLSYLSEINAVVMSSEGLSALEKTL